MNLFTVQNNKFAGEQQKVFRETDMFESRIWICSWAYATPSHWTDMQTPFYMNASTLIFNRKTLKETKNKENQNYFLEVLNQITVLEHL